MRENFTGRGSGAALRDRLWASLP